MKPIIPIGRRDTILDLAHKRTQTICVLMDNCHVSGYDEILRLVDRPVGTPEEIRNETEARCIEQTSKWYDLLANACRWLKDLNLTMRDHVPVYWFDEQEQSIQWTYTDELVFGLDEQDVEYDGQQLFASAIEYFGTVAAEELKTAILDCDVEGAERLMETIKQAMKEYI